MGKWMIDRRYLHSELTGGVIGCAMEVHSALGSGFQEVVYQRSLAAEMLDRGISFSREHEMPIFYKGLQVGIRRVDFLVADVVSVEIKAHTLRHSGVRRNPGKNKTRLFSASRPGNQLLGGVRSGRRSSDQLWRKKLGGEALEQQEASRVLEARWCVWLIVHHSNHINHSSDDCASSQLFAGNSLTGRAEWHIFGII